jgi:hypothetical protein
MNKKDNNKKQRMNQLPNKMDSSVSLESSASAFMAHDTHMT